MPGWHAQTREAVAAGDLIVIGITQEQHPDRCRLFMQWQEMDWPVLVDSLNLLDVKVVPITILIDETGTIHAVNPRPDAVAAFLAAPPAPDGADVAPIAASPPNLDELRAAASAGPSQDVADALQIWGADADRDRAIEIYRELIDADPDDRRSRFRLGVALRRRAESTVARPEDFAGAIDAWESALALDPNQYIWRRRIQQYGPRLDKPYPFYDWVIGARQAIEARGETPHSLRVEPRGAELARPLPRQRGATPPDRPESESPVAAAGPDPDGRVERDDGLIDVRSVIVRDTAGRGAARVHIVMTPDRERDAWWNNEVEPIALHVEPADGLTFASRTIRHEIEGGIDAESREPRTLELEVTIDEAGPARIRGYLLYYVCEGREGTCVYRRRDIDIEIGR